LLQERHFSHGNKRYNSDDVMSVSRLKKRSTETKVFFWAPKGTTDAAYWDIPFSSKVV